MLQRQIIMVKRLFFPAPISKVEGDDRMNASQARRMFATCVQSLCKNLRGPRATSRQCLDVAELT